VSVFIDTSAFLAILDRQEQNHSQARSTWEALVQGGDALIVTNYILLETFALVQNRLGPAASRILQQDIVPILQVYWVDEASHSAGVAALLIANRRQVSLVDCVSFDTMRRLGLKTVFTFDHHFAEQAFICIP